MTKHLNMKEVALKNMNILMHADFMEKEKEWEKIRIEKQNLLLKMIIEFLLSMIVIFCHSFFCQMSKFQKYNLQSLLKP